MEAKGSVKKAMLYILWITAQLVVDQAAPGHCSLLTDALNAAWNPERGLYLELLWQLIRVRNVDKFIV